MNRIVHPRRKSPMKPRVVSRQVNRIVHPIYQSVFREDALCEGGDEISKGQALDLILCGAPRFLAGSTGTPLRPSGGTKLERCSSSERFLATDVPLPVRLILRQRAAILLAGLILVTSAAEALQIPFIEPGSPGVLADYVIYFEASASTARPTPPSVTVQDAPTDATLLLFC